jgi:hypothetical protein
VLLVAGLLLAVIDPLLFIGFMLTCKSRHNHKPMKSARANRKIIFDFIAAPGYPVGLRIL